MFGSFYGRRKKYTSTPLNPCLADLEIPNTKSYFSADEGVFVLFLDVFNLQKCDVIGVDIGERHFGMVGFVKKYLEGDELEKHAQYSSLSWRLQCSQICLLSFPYGLDSNCDYLEDLFRTHAQLEWVRNSTRSGIEQQMMTNVHNMVVARSVKSALRFHYFTKNAGEVYIVKAKCKYTIYPIMNPDYTQPEKADKDNNLKRKKLGYNHAEWIMSIEGDDTTWNAIKILEKFLKKVFDITDAYLIGRYIDLRELNKKKIKKKRKPVTKKILDSETINNEEFTTKRNKNPRTNKKRKKNPEVIDLC